MNYSGEQIMKMGALEELCKLFSESDKLAKRLKRARRRLRAAELEWRQLQSQLPHARVLSTCSTYRPIPEPTLNAHPQGDGLPESSGIYFIWNGPCIDYVGRSINLKKRVRCTHPHFSQKAKISFLLFPLDELGWAECYYIGLARPKFNFYNEREKSISHSYKGLQGRVYE